MTTKELYTLYLRHPQITTDSRDCPAGSIFFALKGESFDGNKFAEAALEKGCAYAVVDDRSMAKDNRYLLVDDVLQTFKDLAREHRRQFHIPVVAITGTNGKTTTKELVSAVLAEKFRVLSTQGNFNNDVGVPKTLFRLSAEHEIAVIEMGASHPGDIKTLAETAEPTCGLITNVGRAHLQGFGSFEGVVRTKGELYDYLATRQDGLVFLNADNSYLLSILPENVWVTPYSTSPENAGDCICGEVTACAPFLEFRWHKPLSSPPPGGDDKGGSAVHHVKTRLIGSYNIDNALAAIAVGINFGVTPEQICHALEHYEPANNRSQFVDTGRNHLVVDAYNANPTSMTAALDNFDRMEADRKMVILGQMNELGDVSDEEHRRLVNRLRKMNLDAVWLVGENFADIKCHYRKFADVNEVKAALREEPLSGRTILIKGSNSTRLFQLPELL